MGTPKSIIEPLVDYWYAMITTTLHIPADYRGPNKLAGSKRTTGADKNSYSMIPFLNSAFPLPLLGRRIRSHSAFTSSTSSRGQRMLSRCSSSPHFHSQTSLSHHSLLPSTRRQMAGKHMTSSFPRFPASVSATRSIPRRTTRSSLRQPISSTTSCRY